MVHVVSGDAVADKLRRWAGEPRLIVWHDILHEGPVPPGLALEELTAIRRQWLEANGFGPSAKLAERDRQLRRLVSRDSVWLSFENDLYDQLQLLQALHFLHRESLLAGPHFLVDTPRDMAVDQMAALAAGKMRLTPAMIETGVRAWEAFTANRAAALLDTDLSSLPHLRPAIERLLQHGPEDNRVEQTILALLQEGGQTATRLFERYQKTEERPFLGDKVFFWYLNRMAPRVVKDASGIYRLPDPQ